MIDSHFSHERVVALFNKWVNRSTTHEIADTVIVAEMQGVVAGFVSISVREKMGSIGLIAVSEQCRGLGIGGLMMNEAHQWMSSKGAIVSSVVTQRSNGAACRLYRRFGYSITSLERVHHFWISPSSTQCEPS
jgi:dTDP-4-amino-4,6-dideoxy-D-galactose acyltransferase